MKGRLIFMTKLHEDFVEKAIRILKADKRIVGISAGGSWITNSMDEYSDIDLVISVKPDSFSNVMDERIEIAKRLGDFLGAFTGEHVNEPRLLICLYGPPLLHVDLKFISAPDIINRVEDPAILWEKNAQVSSYIKQKPYKYPSPDLQWVEDRFWIWIHYAATKLGRGELFEVIEFISYLRQNVIGPFLLMKNGSRPSGVRRIEKKAKKELPLLIETVAEHNVLSCAKSLKAIIRLYCSLREYHKKADFIEHTDVEKESIKYLDEVIDRL